jgi:hypothetical protein
MRPVSRLVLNPRLPWLSRGVAFNSPNRERNLEMTNHERRDSAPPFRTPIIERLKAHIAAGYTPQPGGSASDDTLQQALDAILSLSKPAPVADVVTALADVLVEPPFDEAIVDSRSAAMIIIWRLADAGFVITGAQQ